MARLSSVARSAVIAATTSPSSPPSCATADGACRPLAVRMPSRNDCVRFAVRAVGGGGSLAGPLGDAPVGATAGANTAGAEPAGAVDGEQQHA
eukprot:5371378-Prymnesium_polylepis.1